MSGVNERLCTNKSFKMGPVSQNGRKGKLRISFVSSTSFTYVQVSEKERGVVEGTQWFAETLSTCAHKGICSVLFGAHRLVCLLIMRKGCSSNECGKVLSGQ